MVKNENVKREINSIAITGPTGAIGMAVINYCISQNIELIIITHSGSKRNAHIPNNNLITIIYSDISEYDGIDVGDRHVDAFIHLAWMKTIGDGRNDVEAQLKNIEYTMAAVRLASRLKSKVFFGAGSQAEYGRVDGYLDSDVPAVPENAYGMAKLCAGQMSRLLCEQLGIAHIWGRILSIYGPYDGENTMILSAIRKFMNNEQAAFTKGEQKWDYLYSEDAALIIVKLLQYGNDKRIYCIGNGQCRPLKEYIRLIYEIVTNQVADDEKIGIGRVEYGKKQVMMLCADVSEIREAIGNYELTPFEIGINKTLVWIGKESF